MRKSLSIKHIFEDPHRFLNQEIVVNGWVRSVRHQKQRSFVSFGDGSCAESLQCVLPVAAFGLRVRQLTVGSSASIGGTLAGSPGGGQAVELAADAVDALGACDGESYPLQKKSHSTEFLRSLPHLRMRTAVFGATMRLRHAARRALEAVLDADGFVSVDSPLLTSLDCEGAGEAFRVSAAPAAEVEAEAEARREGGEGDLGEDFFGEGVRPALSVSGQLHAEAAACALSRVYTFAPAFRADPSRTRAHLAEFWMLEPEMAFCDLDGAIGTAEALLRAATRGVAAHCEDLRAVGAPEGLSARLDAPFPRMRYAEALAALTGLGAAAPRFGEDLEKEHELLLVREVAGGAPLVLTHYPRSLKPFYMRVNDEDPRVVDCFDLLVPGVGELVGGSQREEREDVLRENMRRCRIDPAQYEWYLQLRRFGTVKHAGFGMGFERFVQFVTGVENIRDVVPFPRARNLCPL